MATNRAMDNSEPPNCYRRPARYQALSKPRTPAQLLALSAVEAELEAKHKRPTIISDLHWMLVQNVSPLVRGETKAILATVLNIIAVDHPVGAEVPTDSGALHHPPSGIPQQKKRKRNRGTADVARHAVSLAIAWANIEEDIRVQQSKKLRRQGNAGSPQEGTEATMLDECSNESSRTEAQSFSKSTTQSNGEAPLHPVRDERSNAFNPSTEDNQPSVDNDTAISIRGGDGDGEINHSPEPHVTKAASAWSSPHWMPMDSRSPPDYRFNRETSVASTRTMGTSSTLRSLGMKSIKIPIDEVFERYSLPRTRQGSPNTSGYLQNETSYRMNPPPMMPSRGKSTPLSGPLDETESSSTQPSRFAQSRHQPPRAESARAQLPRSEQSRGPSRAQALKAKPRTINYNLHSEDRSTEHSDEHVGPSRYELSHSANFMPSSHDAHAYQDTQSASVSPRGDVL